MRTAGVLVGEGIAQGERPRLTVLMLRPDVKQKSASRLLKHPYPYKI